MENQKIGNIENFSNEKNIGIISDSSPFAENFYFEDFFEENNIKKFIKNTERLIRQSREYDEYISLLRTNVKELNHDNILSKITSADASLEFHHYPFSLFDIVETIMMQHVIDDEKFTSFSIAKEVVDLHYENKIGLVPLSITTHELAHSGNLFISKKQIFGDYSSFKKKYEKGVSADLNRKIKEMEEDDKASDFKGVL